MKKIFSVMIAALMLLSLCMAAQAETYAEVFTNFDQRDTYDAQSAASITFAGDGALISGSGVSADGTVIYITEPGTYILSGECDDGQIVVDVTKDDKVQLVFNGLTLACKNSAPVYVLCADKVSVTLAEGTVNTLTDSEKYTAPFDKQPNACLCSRDDLTINGQGTLTVNALSNNGIGCKNDLKIISGTITVNAANNAVKGNDSVAIKGGVITVNSKDDGIKTENEIDVGKGYIYIEGGQIDITASDDGLQATQDITVRGGSVLAACGGQTINCDGTENITDGCVSGK